MLGEGEAVKSGEMPEAEAVAVAEADQVDADNKASSMPLLNSLFGMPRFKVFVTTGDKAGAGRKYLFCSLCKLIYWVVIERRIGCCFGKSSRAAFACVPRAKILFTVT